MYLLPNLLPKTSGSQASRSWLQVAAYIVKAHIVMAHIAMADVVIAYTNMADVVMADIVMTLCSNGPM